MYLFQESKTTTTWWRYFGFAAETGGLREEDDRDDRYSAGSTLLVHDDGAFCFGPRDEVDDLLSVARYAAEWPLIPVAELHASSVQHPGDLSMRWLLHTRRVNCIPASGVAQPAGQDALPKPAGVGDRDATVWCCKLCVDNLCKERPRMPPLALANAFFGGRHHPLFREATLATRMLASSARLIARQLFLGKGAGDEVHKGATGNAMLIAQPSPSYEQVLPNLSAVSEGLVVLFCKSVDDVAKAQMLVVNREEYREMVRYRRKVCPTFAHTEIDEAAIDKLPHAAVPDDIIESAQAMPEAANVRTVMQGPANRIPMFSRQGAEEDQDSGGDTSAEEQADGADLHRAVDGGQKQGEASSLEEHTDADCEHALLPAEPLNEHETVIGVDEESCPQPLRLFEAWNVSMAHTKGDLHKLVTAAAILTVSAAATPMPARSLLSTNSADDVAAATPKEDNDKSRSPVPSTTRRPRRSQSVAAGALPRHLVRPNAATATPSADMSASRGT